MIKIYAKPETSFTIINSTMNLQKPKGFVEMLTDHPTIYSICKDNGDGTGYWVEPSKLSIFQKKIYNYMISNKYKFFIPLRNFFCLVNNEKKFNFILLAITLVILIIFQLNGNTVKGSILLSICAATIFNILIIIIPQEQKKINHAKEIGLYIDNLVCLKNCLYISIGYLENPILQLDYPTISTDQAMNREKGLKIIDLIVKNINHKLTISLNDIPFNNNITIFKTNQEFFIWSKQEIIIKIKELSSLVDKNIFPDLSRTLKFLSFQYNNTKYFDSHELTDSHIASMYVGHYFRLIECIQLVYDETCYPYLEYRNGSTNFKLIYDNESKQSLKYLGFTSYL